jgi:hypothetical protein
MVVDGKHEYVVEAVEGAIGMLELECLRKAKRRIVVHLWIRHK